SINLDVEAHEEPIHIRQLSRELGRGSTPASIDNPGGLGAKQFESGCGQIVRDDDFQCGFAGAMLRTKSAASAIRCAVTFVVNSIRARAARATIDHPLQYNPAILVLLSSHLLCRSIEVRRV